MLYMLAYSSITWRNFLRGSLLSGNFSSVFLNLWVATPLGVGCGAMTLSQVIYSYKVAIETWGVTTARMLTVW